MKELLYGAAYYDEYMPEERLSKDIQMLKDANINVIRIAESTWSSEEISDNIFDMSHIIRVLEATKDTGISVIVGTPTYAIPPWLARKFLEILATTKNGKELYGRRQNMDITHPVYLFYAERIIRKLMETVCKYDHVIGFQLDNETKHYDTSSENVQKMFVEYLKKKFVTVEAMNKEFGFNYWSNRVDCWENVPNTLGTINGSFGAEFKKFQRTLVNDFLQWQSNIVREYANENQFITHNFDYAWRDYSFGVQADVDHKEACKALTISGCDIYHKSQNNLTGTEISFAGDISRCLKNDNYLVIETEAQGHVDWQPFNNQLRLCAFSHVANGANAVMYWHWHSIHNSAETYWKGILSHYLKPNRIYREVSTIGADFKRIGQNLVNLKIKNKVAIYVSNKSLTAFDYFGFGNSKLDYNDIFRFVYDSLYKMNIQCDIIFPQDVDKISNYEMLITPVLYSASDYELETIKSYVKDGGILISTFKTGFSNEYLTVRNEEQPGILAECFGMSYDEFTIPDNISLIGDNFAVSDDDRKIKTWMEMLIPTTATTIAKYDTNSWGECSAITENKFGKGTAYYLACHTSENYFQELIKYIFDKFNLFEKEQSFNFPIIIKKGVNDFGKKIVYYFNYSANEQELTYIHDDAMELVSNTEIKQNDKLILKPWDFKIFQQN